MNFLVHIYLSKDREDTLVGNFLGDYLKGDINKFPPFLRTGIIFHRKIDSFSNSHKSHIKNSNILKTLFGRFAPIAVDILADIYLFESFHLFEKQDRVTFFNNIRSKLLEKSKTLDFPILQTLRRRNWFLEYRENNALFFIHRRLHNYLEIKPDDFLKLYNDNKEVLFNNYFILINDLKKFFQ
ncbi:hypothetical protein FHQ18_05520 [Deferribacter autotrophicus]|uniref:DUF479 domain-containing protein n=1 Tax=Deferribacter autotrophicus TaxID=500465 RepID=A0A5A8F401_9BACT|nr:hypothetical protein [Deferribacter autotrophicus]KAA0258618.1 hypothetical protein FHQ18_05520 [Deferribacter autotrophicus]